VGDVQRLPAALVDRGQPVEQHRRPRLLVSVGPCPPPTVMCRPTPPGLTRREICGHDRPLSLATGRDPQALASVFESCGVSVPPRTAIATGPADRLRATGSACTGARQ